MTSISLGGYNVEKLETTNHVSMKINPVMVDMLLTVFQYVSGDGFEQFLNWLDTRDDHEGSDRDSVLSNLSIMLGVMTEAQENLIKVYLARELIKGALWGEAKTETDPKPQRHGSKPTTQSEPTSNAHGDAAGQSG